MKLIYVKNNNDKCNCTTVQKCLSLNIFMNDLKKEWVSSDEHNYLIINN